MEIINSREIATALWLVALLLLGLKNEGFVKSLIALLKSIADIKIVFTLEALALYLMLIGFISSTFINWGFDELKSATMWFFFVGTVLLYKSITQDDGYKPINSWAKNTFTLVIFLEFLATKYTFNIFIELILVPFLAIVTMMSVIAERDEKTKSVAKLCQAVLVLIGLTMLVHGIWRFTTDEKAHEGLRFFQELSLPILLSFLTIPFFYFLHAYVAYEKAFIRLQWSLRDDTLREQTKRKAICRFGLHLGALKRWTRLMQEERPENLNAVDALITSAHQQHNLSKNPPQVSPRDGWSPYVAKDFLSSKGVKTFDYRDSLGEWYAESHVQKPEGPFSKNFMVYYIEGTQTVAKRLRLKLTLNDLNERDQHLNWMQALAYELLRHALPTLDINIPQLFNGKTKKIEKDSKRVSLCKETINAGKLTIEEYTFQVEVID